MPAISCKPASLGGGGWGFPSPPSPTLHNSCYIYMSMQQLTQYTLTPSHLRKRLVQAFSRSTAAGQSGAHYTSRQPLAKYR